MKRATILSVLLVLAMTGRSQDSFVWTTWDKVSAKVKTEMKAVKYDKRSSLYDAILKYKKEGVEDADISVAVLDMDKDGKSEYAVAVQSSDYCGTLGCSLEVYKDGGAKQIHLTDQIEEVKPKKNGVLSSAGKLIPFESVAIK